MIHRIFVLEEDRALTDRVIRAFISIESCAAAVSGSASGICQSLARFIHDLVFDLYNYLSPQIHAWISSETKSHFVLAPRSIGVYIPLGNEEPAIRDYLLQDLDSFQSFALVSITNRQSSREAKHG
jgi:hypothetical protein